VTQSVKRLFSSREDIFDAYSQEYFEKVFGGYFKILETVKVEKSDRVMSLMVKKS
jgi:hypothetical protein